MRLKFALAALLAILASAQGAFAQGCALCYTSASAVGAAGQRSLDYGILALADSRSGPVSQRDVHALPPRSFRNRIIPSSCDLDVKFNLHAKGFLWTAGFSLWGLRPCNGPHTPTG